MLEVLVIIAAIGLAIVAVRVFANNNSTQENIKQKNIVIPIPAAIVGIKILKKNLPKELDETAYVDGYSFGRFFFKIFIPTIAAGIGITMFFCFMFSWVELILAKTLTATIAKPIAAIMTRTSSTSGYELGLLAAAGSLTIIPGAVVIYFVRNYIAKGFAMGRV